jgi:4-hydroxybenzoate polyprenyltransferase
MSNQATDNRQRPQCSQRSFLPSFLDCMLRAGLIIYTLELVGALVVTAFGWASCRMLHTSAMNAAPLWFSGYLFVYNFDRLYLDPADLMNTPIRSRLQERLRPARRVLVGISGVILVVWPMMIGVQWLALVAPIVALVLQFYSRPIPSIIRFYPHSNRGGLRLKDIPVIKSLLAPLMITVITVLWPVIENSKTLDVRVGTVFLWSLSGLLINGLIFDFRDLKGDVLQGTRTLAVTLGAKGTLRLVGICSAIFVGLSIGLTWNQPDELVLSVGLTIGSLALLGCAIRPVHPALLSFVADLFLLIPWVAMTLARH